MTKESESVTYQLIWNVDFDDVTNYLEYVSYKEASEILQIPETEYRAMTVGERYDCMFEFCFNGGVEMSREVMQNALGLPSEVRLSRDADPDDMVSYFSEKYGCEIFECKEKGCQNKDGRDGGYDDYDR